ncbi:MAG: hypothetical protein ACQSGP_28745 [Frankia sp.]
MPENNPTPTPATDPTPALPGRLQIEQITEAAVTGALRALDARRRASKDLNLDLPFDQINTSILAGWGLGPIVVGGIFPITTLPTFPEQVPDPTIGGDQ